MAGTGNRACRALAFLFALLLAAQLGLTAACADDAGQLRLLPGPWTYTDYVEDENGADREVDLAVLTLMDNGEAILVCNGVNGKYAYSCRGTWSFDYVPDGMDRLTLTFTETDDPSRAGNAYFAECVYDMYTESWDEEDRDTRVTYLILESAGSTGVTPFEELSGYDSPALKREEGPNMRVVNCDSFVSLREKRSTSSKRLTKVPLGALVLAFPEYEVENGFLFCLYHGQYGYILAEYLEPIE